MAGDEQRSDTYGGWAALAGLTPLFVLANGFAVALALGMTFLVAHSTSATVALLLPARFGKGRIFGFAVLGAAIAASLTASVVRMLDPFLFETAHAGMFLTAFTLPVLRSSVMPDTVAERERAMERMLRGLGFALTIVAFGVVRELVASGDVALRPGAASALLLPIATQPAGAFFLLALVAAGFKAIAGIAKGPSR